MSKQLVIVESPTKAKTISKFLGKDYTVESSFGHVRDLPKSKIGVDVENDFEPHYMVPARAKKRVTELKKLAEKADMIYFATDEDREGEAISWHLAELLKAPVGKTKRIAFHEITKEAVEEALQNPRTIDQHLVDAQQARRILDRLVGYELSPFLWKKVARGLSAGRVQSVAVRLLVEREREIEAFQAQEYWTIDAIFSDQGTQFTAKLNAVNGATLDKFDINTEAKAAELVKALDSASYTVGTIDKKTKNKNPLPPFTTSTMQQEANHRLGFSAKQTMMLAQQLYEGVELGDEGSVGLITYMRTDSVNLSDKFLRAAEQYIVKTFGKEYSSGTRVFKGKSKLAQEAHEAIRPTEVTYAPEQIKTHLSAQQYKLYQLIWQRAVASQMTPAIVDTTSVDIDASTGKHQFRATGSVITFDGYLKVYPTSTQENILPQLTKDQAVNLDSLTPEQHFTQPPARYSEATLVKAMEEHGIGRPSTYAPTIATIQDRGYVIKETNKLKPTDLGIVVNDLLVEHFNEIVDYGFTAELEDDFDNIAEGKRKWQEMLKNFYTPFHKHLEEKEESVTKEDVLSIQELGIDPKTNKPVYVRMGKYGPFVQLGSKDDEEKPKFAPLPANKAMQSVTLEDALVYLSLPRLVGQTTEGQDIQANIGKFGPYLKIDKKYVSLKEHDPYTVTLEQALEIIAAHQEIEAKKHIKTFPDSTVEVLNGRYGAYITDGTKNAKIPKDTTPEELTLEQCQELLEKFGKKKGTGRRFTRKKAE